MLTELEARIGADLRDRGLWKHASVRWLHGFTFTCLRTLARAAGRTREAIKAVLRELRRQWWLFQSRARSARLRLGHAARAWVQVPQLVAALLERGRSGPLPALTPHVVMLVVSDVRVDPRVQKSAMAAAARGLRVTVIAPSHRIAMPAPRAPDWGPGIAFEFPEISSWALLNQHLPWLVDTDLLAHAQRYRGVVFHGHDLNTALMALQLARQTGSACIADFHEWFSENVEWRTRHNAYVRNRWLKRTVMRRAERLCLRHADAVITVCDSIARELQAMQRRPDGVHVVRNIPDMAPTMGSPVAGTLRAQCGVADDQFLLLWQGGVGPSRLLEPVIQSLQYASGVVIAIRGPGLEPGAPFRAHYEQVAAQAGVGDRLRLLPPVPSRYVVAAASGADAGVWTLPNLSKNFYYALPNKIFEYLAAGLPVIVADFPEAAGLVRRYGIGLSFDPYDPQSIAAAINALKADPQARQRMAANTVAALADMDAGREWSRVADLYQSLIERRERSDA
jgi:glycosyltransferase involved in cell wall biosynthesis